MPNSSAVSWRLRPVTCVTYALLVAAMAEELRGTKVAGAELAWRVASARRWTHGSNSQQLHSLQQPSSPAMPPLVRLPRSATFGSHWVGEWEEEKIKKKEEFLEAGSMVPCVCGYRKSSSKSCFLSCEHLESMTYKSGILENYGSTW